MDFFVNNFSSNISFYYSVSNTNTGSLDSILIYSGVPNKRVVLINVLDGLRLNI